MNVDGVASRPPELRVLVVDGVRAARWAARFEARGDATRIVGAREPLTDAALVVVAVDAGDEGLARAVAACRASRDDTGRGPYVVAACDADAGDAVVASLLGAGAADVLFDDDPRLDARLAVVEHAAARGAAAARAREAAIEDAERAALDFQRVIEVSPDAVAISVDGALVYANAALCRCLGVAAPLALIGRALLDQVHGDDREMARALDAQAAASTHAPTPSVCRFVRADADVATLELIVVPLAHFEGARGLLWVGRDVTERLRLQSRLLLADRMASLGTLAAGVAHELNNPLSYVLGNIVFLGEELAAIEAELPSARMATLTETLRDAHEGAERMRSIVRDLRAFSRTEGRAGDGAMSLPRAVESAVKLVRAELRHRATLRLELGETPAVRGDEGKLVQVVVNLLVNAAHAIPEGHVEQNEIVVLTARGPDGGAVLEVRDTGAGIAREAVGRIFDPFYTTKEPGEGTGLGLSICHGIVASMHGEITVASEPGHGSTFRVALPAMDAARDTDPEPARATAPPVGLASAPPPRGAPRSAILVVDDEPAVAATVARLLGAEHAVRAVTSGSHALELVRAGERFDAILCDLMMPDSTGMDLCAALGEIAPAQLARVVILTAGAFTPAARAFLDGYAGPRLDKPFDAERLREVVRAVLESTASARSP